MKKIIILTLICTIASTAFAQRVDFDKKLKELGVELFVPGKPIANYVKAVRTGNLLFLAGHGPTKADGTNMLGKLGKDMTVEQGYMAARQTAISLLSTLKILKSIPNECICTNVATPLELDLRLLLSYGLKHLTELRKVEDGRFDNCVLSFLIFLV